LFLGLLVFEAVEAVEAFEALLAFDLGLLVLEAFFALLALLTLLALLAFGFVTRDPLIRTLLGARCAPVARSASPKPGAPFPK
jgi:hypothetical protein